MTAAGPVWTGDVRLVLELLAQPLKWKKPRRIFVNSMSDLFHENLKNSQIASVFGIMAACPQHTFQILTKRPKRMREWFAWAQPRDGVAFSERVVDATAAIANLSLDPFIDYEWPLPNVWLGVSVEGQRSADERILPLLETPAAIRWVSYEPALAPIDLMAIRPNKRTILNVLEGCGVFVRGACIPCPYMQHIKIDWVVLGGESGPGARPFDLSWARDVISQCRHARVPVFIKQDSGRLPGQQGRFSDDEWAIKEFPP